MKKYLLFPLLFIFFSSSAQMNKIWDHRYGGTKDDLTGGIISTSDGGALVFGYSYSDSSGDKLEDLKGLQDYWVVKVDGAGVMEWNRDFGGTGYYNYLTCAVETPDGGFVLGGWTPADSSFDKSEDNRGGNDFWIIKTDANGNKLWDKTYGGNNDDFMSGICLTPDGGLLLGGTTNSDSSGDKISHKKGHADYWIIKTDANGQYEWEKDYGGSKDDYLKRVVQTFDNGFYIFGTSNSDSSYDKSQNTKGTFDFWIIKVDGSGNYLWDRDYGSTGDDNGFSAFMDVTLDNGAVFGNTCSAGVGGDKTVSNWSVFSDFWILRIDSTGTKLWDQHYGGVGEEDEFWNVFHTMDGGFLVSGDSYSGVSGDKSQPNLGAEQAWCIKVDGNGNKIWDNTLENDDHNEGGTVTETADGCIIMNTYSLADSGGDKSEDSWSHSLDYFFAKFCYGIIPVSQFAVSDSAFCKNSCITFTDETLNSPTSWQWYFPGGNPSSSADQNPVVCYDSSGLFTVTLITYNSAGSDTITFNNFISVLSSVPVDVYQSGDTLFASAGLNCQWFANGIAISGATDFFYVPSQQGIFEAVVTDSNGCQSSDSAYFSLAPGAAFSTSQPELCEKFCIDYTDMSTNDPDAWQWYFPGGDPAASTFQHPTNICYNTPGIFDVTLISSNAYGSDTLLLTGYITVHPTPPIPIISQSGVVLTASPADFYQWQLNSLPIPGATNASYTVSQTGLYTVIVMDSNGCQNSATLYVAISGVGEIATSAFTVYPNPATDQLFIEGLSAVSGPLSVHITNTDGQVIFQSEETIASAGWLIKIDVTGFHRGVYLLSITSDSGTSDRKIIIEK